jgi:REP element-mobilizing transposase RayT
MRSRRPSQVPLSFSRRGGARAGAGRPRKEKRTAPHRARPEHAHRFPVHVTLRVKERVWNLRSQRCYNVISRAFRRGCDRFGLRLTHYSVQGNHLHLIVEAGDARALARGAQGLTIRIAKGLNRLMAARGAVFAERYFARELHTPKEVRNALDYVYNNAHRHWAAAGRPVKPFYDELSSARWFTGWTQEDAAQVRVVLGEPTGPPPVARSRTWLLGIGWKRHGLIELG